MDIVNFAVDEAVSDLVLPIAYEFAGIMIVLYMPSTYVTVGDRTNHMVVEHATPGSAESCLKRLAWGYSFLHNHHTCVML